MPLYDFKCTDCGHADTEYDRMSSAVPIGDCKTCPKCSQPTFRRQPDLAHTDLKEFHDPIEMYSIAMETDDDIRTFIRSTGIDVSLNPEDPMYGVPIVCNRKQKLAALKHAGFVEVN